VKPRYIPREHPKEFEQREARSGSPARCVDSSVRELTRRGLDLDDAASNSGGHSSDLHEHWAVPLGAQPQTRNLLRDGREALRRYFVARHAFDGVSLALRDGFQIRFALPTLRARFGHGVSAHRVAAYRAIIT